MARNAPSIDAYGDGGFRLSGIRHEGSVLILKDVAVAWPVSTLSDLSVDHISEVIAAGSIEVEFLLLGTGARNGLPPRELRDALKAAGIGIEFMDTPTAARMYNLLTAEGRRLAAGLIAI